MQRDFSWFLQRRKNDFLARQDSMSSNKKYCQDRCQQGDKFKLLRQGLSGIRERSRQISKNNFPFSGETNVCRSICGRSGGIKSAWAGNVLHMSNRILKKSTKYWLLVPAILDQTRKFGTEGGCVAPCLIKQIRKNVLYKIKEASRVAVLVVFGVPLNMAQISMPHDTTRFHIGGIVSPPRKASE